jgi:hypothetical protein
MRGTSGGTGEHSMKEKTNECIFLISRNPKNHENPNTTSARWIEEQVKNPRKTPHSHTQTWRTFKYTSAHDHRHAHVSPCPQPHYTHATLPWLCHIRNPIKRLHGREKIITAARITWENMPWRSSPIIYGFKILQLASFIMKSEMMVQY